MTNTITVEIAPGELIDKITILQIKSERIDDPAKVANVRIELQTLETCRDANISASSDLADMTAQLREINEALWEIEDDIRDCERAGDFGDTFVQLARAVYKTNDQRAEVKRDINTLLGSRLVEEKSYQPY